MTLHIYQARLLHYIVVSANSGLSPLPPKQQHPNATNAAISTSIMPVNSGEVIQPEYIAKGALVVDDTQGIIVDYGESAAMLARYQHQTASHQTENPIASNGITSNKLNSTKSNTVKVHDLKDKLLMPGFIDTHVHYPQLEMMAAYGEQLLDWLNNYTFVTEARFGCAQHAQNSAAFFLQQLLAHGTTSAMVFATSHLTSAQAFFAQSEQLGTRMICGNVLMDQNAPKSLCVPAAQGIKDTQRLIDLWHHNGRQLVAITPRFAITSSPQQLKMAGELYANNKGVYLQTHLAENQDEIAAVKRMYPNHSSYLAVYDKMGLLGRHTTLAHGIYLEETDYLRLQATGSQIAHCPTSNLFLGSGLFDLSKTLGFTGVSIATDVGAGTSLSLLATLSAAYKVQQLQNKRLCAHQGLYQITLGNAQSLQLEDKIGNFARGSEADFIVIDTQATPLLQRRQSQVQAQAQSAHNSLDDELFVLMMLGDDRVIAQTYIAGQCQYHRG